MWRQTISSCPPGWSCPPELEELDVRRSGWTACQSLPDRLKHLCVCKPSVQPAVLPASLKAMAKAGNRLYSLPVLLAYMRTLNVSNSLADPSAGARQAEGA
ncbi:hypothetical protein O5541_01935 [Escherichia coli]|nr:hypothetical protein [Escherichia coli]